MGIDPRVGPGEIDLVHALHKRHNPLFLHQRGLGMIELDLDPLPHRQRDELDARAGRLSSVTSVPASRTAQNNRRQSFIAILLGSRGRREFGWHVIRSYGRE